MSWLSPGCETEKPQGHDEARPWGYVSQVHPARDTPESPVFCLQIGCRLFSDAAADMFDGSGRLLLAETKAYRLNVVLSAVHELPFHGVGRDE